MADKGAKKKAKSKQAKAAAQPSVLASLPGQRPERIGASRRGRAAKPPEGAESGAPQQAAAKTAAAARPAAAERSAAAKTGAARPSAAAKTGAAGPSSAPPPRREPVSPPRGTKLVTTAIQAVGELAQIGLTVGGQVVKRAVDRLPKR